MAMLIPEAERIFVFEYVQLQAVPNADEDPEETRVLLAEGPLVLGRLAKQAVPVIQIGVPENMMTWQLTGDLPVLKVSSYAVMFAVPYSQQYYLVEFLPETPPDVLATFEACLQQFTSYAVSEDVQQASAIPGSEKVASQSGAQFTTAPGLASNMRQAGTAVASGVHTVGEWVGRGIVQAGEWYRSRYAPCEESTKVSDQTKARLDRTKKTTETIAKVTTAVAGAVGTAIGSVAHGAVSSAKKAGVAKEGSTSRHAAQVGKAGLVALVEVFDAMHDAGRHVVKQGATETATCVQYRYGDEAAEATHKGMHIAVDAYDVYGAYKSMRTKALVKAFAKGAVQHPEGQQGDVPSAAYAPMETGQSVGSTGGGAAVLATAPPSV
eukprot:jgi/Ulvmu1/9812/UM056_0053.1